MYSYDAAAARSIYRTLQAAVIVVAAALLLPLTAGAAPAQELPQELSHGHWSYDALAEVLQTGVLQILGDSQPDPTQTRSRYEMALITRKIMAVLEAETFGTAAPDLPLPVQLQLRLRGLQRQLLALSILAEALENDGTAAGLVPFVQSAQPANAQSNSARAQKLLAQELPSLHTELAALESELRSSAGASDAQLEALNQRANKLLTGVQAVQTAAMGLVPSVYNRVWDNNAPTLIGSLAVHLQQGQSDNPLVMAQQAMSSLSALRREFAVEMAVLNPATDVWPDAVVARLPAVSQQHTPPATEEAPGPALTSAPAAEVASSEKAISIDDLSSSLQNRQRENADNASSSGTDRSLQLQPAGEIIGRDDTKSGFALATGAKVSGTNLVQRFQQEVSPAPHVPESDSGKQSMIVVGNVERKTLVPTTLPATGELVDIDRLRSLSESVKPETNTSVTPGASSVSVDSAVKLGDTGALRVGYELTQSRTDLVPAYSSSAGVELNITDKARLSAEYNLDADRTGLKSSAHVGVGYEISSNSSLTAQYQLVNFGDAGSYDYISNVAQAKFTLVF